MARETYTDTTPQTVAALEGHVKAIADEWEKSEQFVRAILGGASNDPHLKYRKFFRVIARKNPDGARGYLSDFIAIFRREVPRPCGENDHLLAFKRAVDELVFFYEFSVGTDEERERAKVRVVGATAKLWQRDRSGVTEHMPR